MVWSLKNPAGGVVIFKVENFLEIISGGFLMKTFKLAVVTKVKCFKQKIELSYVVKKG